jgi:broad specificity phosphatase PhoE
MSQDRNSSANSLQITYNINSDNKDKLEEYDFHHLKFPYFPPFLTKINNHQLNNDPKPERLPFTKLNLLNGYSYSDFLRDSSALTSTPQREVKTLYFVRHAQGIHNLAESQLGSERWDAVESKEPTYFDAKLTELGENQTKELFSALQHMDKTAQIPFDLLVVSPLSRAIETAQIAFSPLFNDPKFPIISHELIRETLGVHTCDQRRNLTQLRNLYPRIAFPGNFFVAEEDKLWRAEHRESDEEQRARALQFLHFLYDSYPEKRHILIVAHGGIIRAIAEILGNSGTLERSEVITANSHDFQLANCEFLPITAVRTSKN